MNLASKLTIQAIAFGVAGGLAGYFLGPIIQKNTATELTQALGNISAIAGSLLGWSVGWLAQSRTLIKEIDYDSARELFRELGSTQHELIWRWGIVFSCSIAVVIGAVVMKNQSFAPETQRLLLTSSTSLLSIALGFIAYLFQRMLALAKLKSQLDEYEHDELRKKRLSPPRES